MLVKINSLFQKRYLSIILALALFVLSSVPVYADGFLNNGDYPGLNTWVSEYALNYEVSEVGYYFSNTNRVVTLEEPSIGDLHTVFANQGEVCGYTWAIFSLPSGFVFYDGSTEVYDLRLEFDLIVNNSALFYDGEYYDIADHFIFRDKNNVDLNFTIDVDTVLDPDYNQPSYFKFTVDFQFKSLWDVNDTSNVIDLVFVPPASFVGAGADQNQFNFSPYNITATGIANADPDSDDASLTVLGDLLNSVDTLSYYFESGNSASQSAGAAIDNANDSFNDVAGQYEQIEQNYTDSMVNDLDAIKDDVEGFNLSGNILMASRWIGTEMMSIFNNFSDFKMYIIVPCILGLALFFIGRGSIFFK